MTVNNGGLVLTALILAGGSNGINSILVALGVRQVITPQTIPKPPATKAWIAVRAIRDPADKGDIDVMIGPMQTVSNSIEEPPLAGTIKGESGLGFLAFFQGTGDVSRSMEVSMSNQPRSCSSSLNSRKGRPGALTKYLRGRS